MDDEQVAQHPAFTRMQSRYLDDIASMGEKIQVIDENYDRKDALVREQAATIALLVAICIKNYEFWIQIDELCSKNDDFNANVKEHELANSANREELVNLREDLNGMKDENSRLLSHNQHLRGRLSLVQGDEFAEDDIEVADMSDWSRDQREQYIGKIVERLFSRSRIDR